MSLSWTLNSQVSTNITNISKMDNHDAENSNRAASSSSPKKKGGKKKARAQANANSKKPNPKSQRSETLVLRVIDGNAAPSPPTSSSSDVNNTEPIFPTQSKKGQRVAFEDEVGRHMVSDKHLTRISLTIV